MEPSPTVRILAADVGGTHTRLGIFLARGEDVDPLTARVVPSAEYVSLGSLVAAFLAESGGRVDAACLGVAGPVLDDSVDVTNLPWQVRAADLAREIGTDRIHLLNDLEATAWGMLELGEEAFEVLQPGTRPARRGTIAVVAAGTGFGEAALFWDGARHHPMATEAGHTSFAARTDRDRALHANLRAKYGHVSLERVISGPGLEAIHAFLREESGAPPPTDPPPDDPSRAIATAALAGSDPVCVEALALFVEAYGAAAGDAALRHLSLGGVWIAGGIAPQLLPALREGAFLDAFRDKGRFAPLLASLQVAVCIAPNPALYGAARFAARQALD